MNHFPALAVLAGLLPLAAAAQTAAQIAAPTQAQTGAQTAPQAAPETTRPAVVLTPAQAAAQEMISVFEEFCLVRFPDPQSFAAGAQAHHMAAASQQQASESLLGRPGQAWQITTTKGKYLVAIESGGRQGCAVSGDVADDAGIRVTFDLLVSSYASAHEFGVLDHPPLRHADLHGQPADIELIGSNPDGRARQAFVNMAVGRGDTRHVRLTREFAPPDKAQ